MIRTKRVYDAPSAEDGYRLLVMRLWPRGIPKGAVGGWERELGPSRGLLEEWRRGGIPWEEFARLYRLEMAAQGEVLAALAARAARETVTLLCGCGQEERCHRALLKELLEEAVAGGVAPTSGPRPSDG